jgi:hypothetical protein
MPRPRAACSRDPRNFYHLADLDEDQTAGASGILLPPAGFENKRNPPGATHSFESATAWWCCCMTYAAICLLDEEPLTKPIGKGDVLS